MLPTAGSIRRRIRALAALALVVATSMSCSGTEPEPAAHSAHPSGGAPITAAETSDDDAIRAVFNAYWAAVVASENGPDSDRGLFDGIAIGDAVERQIFRVQGLIANKIQRIGEPVIGKPDISVDRSTARVEACVDQDQWLAVVDGSTPAPQPAGPRPMAVDLQQVDGTWLVTAPVPQEEATLTC